MKLPSNLEYGISSRLGKCWKEANINKGSQFFKVIIETKSGPDASNELKIVIKFLIILGVIDISCIALVQKRIAGPQLVK